MISGLTVAWHGHRDEKRKTLLLVEVPTEHKDFVTSAIQGIGCDDENTAPVPLAEYDDWQHRLAFAEDELKKLRAVAKTAGEYLDARFWDEDEDVVEAAGEALASAMNAWKGIIR